LEWRKYKNHSNVVNYCHWRCAQARWAGRINSGWLRLPALAELARVELGAGWSGIRISLCEYLNIDPMHVKVTRARNSMLQCACGTRVQRHSPVVARPQIEVSSSQWSCNKDVLRIATGPINERIFSMAGHVVNSGRANSKSSSVNAMHFFNSAPEAEKEALNDD